MSLYCDGAAIKDDDDIDADGVKCNFRNTTGDGVFAIDAGHAESGVLYYTDRKTTYTLQIQIHAPETGFFAIPERNMTYYLEDLNILNSETTVYFFGAKSGDTVSFSVEPNTGAMAGALTVSPETITAGSDPIAVTLTDHAASADAYGKKGFRVCVQINGKQAEEALHVNRSEDYGKAAAYDFYSYWDGQYRLLEQLRPKETAGGMISAVAYLRRADGTPFTQTELSALNIAFTPNGSSQNAVTLTETLTKDGAIAVTATLDNTYSIEGAIRVRDGAGLELASLWLKYASWLQAYGKVEFEYQDADYSIGFVDGAASGNEEYPEFIRNTWSHNSALNDDTPEVDPFYLAIAQNDNKTPTAQPDLYRNLIDSVTFTLLDAGAGTEMPAYHSDKHTKGWDMVTIETYLKNAGSWALQADIIFRQPVWINQRTGGPIQTRNLQLAITFQRTLVPEIRIDLRDKDNLWKDAGGTTFDAMKTVQAYLALLEEKSGVETIQALWGNSDHADWAGMLTNPEAELWFTLPAERYAGDLSAGKLVRQIGLTGTEENGAVTTIQGSVFRTNNSDDDGTLALSDLHLQGKGKEEPYFDAAKTRPNYGIYSAGGNIEIEGCTLEDYWAAVWDAPLPDSASKPREMLSLFGGNRNVFRNNRYGVYTDCCRMDDTANRPTIMRSTFEGNTYGIYIQSLLRREGYRYMVKFCKFLDNTCDIYNDDTCRLFFPSNYFGQTQSGQTVSRDPIVEGRRVKVILDKTTDASGKIRYQYADIDTETLLTLDPILLNADFDQSGTLRLGVRTGTSSFSMRNDDAGTMKMDAASLINRASQLMIRMVEQSAASDDSDGTDEEASDVPELLDDTTTLGIWNIAAK
ncbi:hypothetical protein JQM60_08995 [Butyricicoccus pullicaecorum]|nr:hypothetical protein [Butyricicoccus pullicaecorum]